MMEKGKGMHHFLLLFPLSFLNPKTTNGEADKHGKDKDRGKK